MNLGSAELLVILAVLVALVLPVALVVTLVVVLSRRSSPSVAQHGAPPV